MISMRSAKSISLIKCITALIVLYIYIYIYKYRETNRQTDKHTETEKDKQRERDRQSEKISGSLATWLNIDNLYHQWHRVVGLRSHDHRRRGPEHMTMMMMPVMCTKWGESGTWTWWSQTCFFYKVIIKHFRSYHGKWIVIRSRSWDY